MRINKLVLVSILCYSSAFAMPLFSKSYNLANILDSITEFRGAARSCEDAKVRETLARIKKRVTLADKSVNRTSIFTAISRAIADVPARCEPAQRLAEDMLIGLEMNFLMGAKEEIAKLGGRSPSLIRVLEKNKQDIADLGDRLGVMIREEASSDRMMKNLEARMKALNDREEERVLGRGAGAGSAK